MGLVIVLLLYGTISNALCWCSALDPAKKAGRWKPTFRQWDDDNCDESCTGPKSKRMEFVTQT
eukprot:scaffold12240_cov170-Amphora_coffeaeformis.AAC.6